MRPAPGVVLLLVTLLVTAGTVGTVGAAGAADTSAGAAGVGPTAAAMQDGPQPLADCAADSPPSLAAPEGGDAIGYVDGFWYDEEIRIPVEDGTNDTGTGERSGAADGATTDGAAASPNATVGNTSTNVTEEGTRTAAVGANETATGGNGTAGGPAGDPGTGEPAPEADGNETDDGGVAPDEDDAPGQVGPTRPFDPEDGIDAAEREAYVARTAARVEAMRCLNFASVPEVDVRNRSAIRTQRERLLANRSGAAEQFDQARLEAALLLGSEANATEARIDNLSSSSLGYYSPAADRIVLVTNGDDELRIDEPTLAHELVHALQDQHFDLDRFDDERTDHALGESGLIEGDASLVEYHYRTRCEGAAWATDCLRYSGGGGGDSGHVALELLFFQPYNDGPRYAQRIYQAEGWDGLDRRFDAVPNSSKQTIFVDTPGDFVAEPVTIEAVQDPSWVRIRPSDAPAAGRLGPGAIAAAAIAPTFDTDTGQLYGAQFLTNNLDEERLQPLRPYNYRVDAASGWTGGRLQAYRSPSGDLGSIWRTTWEDAADAQTFRQRYLELLTLHGATADEAYVGTARFAASSQFDGYVSVLRNDSTVTVVHAGSVGGLRGLDADAAQPAPDGYSFSMERYEETKSDDAARLPGPGPLGAALALLAAAGLLAGRLHRRRSD